MRATPKGDLVSAASMPGSWDDSAPLCGEPWGGAHGTLDPVIGWMPVPHLGRGLQIAHLEHVGG